MCVQRVDRGLRRQRRLHLPTCVRLEPPHLATEDHVQPWIGRRVQTLQESAVTVLAGRRRHETLQFHDPPLALQTLADPTPGLPTDQHVVGPDEAGVLVTLDLAVEHDHGDTSSVGLRDRLGQRRGLLGADNQQVDPLLDELLDLRTLGQRVVLRVLEDHAHNRVCCRRGAHVGVHLHPPRLAHGGLAHSDQERIIRGPRVSPHGFGTAPERAQGQEGEDGELRECHDGPLCLRGLRAKRRRPRQSRLC